MRKTIKCSSGKPGHPDQWAALFFLGQRIRQGYPERHVYECKFCGEWHTTSLDLSNEKRNVNGTVIKFSESAGQGQVA